MTLFVAVAVIAWGAAFGASGPHPAKASPGSPVAVPEEWTPTTQVFDNGDGTSTADIHAAPVQAPDPTSETGWSPIDTTLQSGPDGLEPDLTDASVQFSDGGQSDPLATVEQDGASLSVGWTGDASTPTVVGDTASYPDVLPGVDATLQAKPYGFEESFLVASAADAPETLDIPLDITGMTAALNDADMLVLTDSSGAVVGSADPAMMWGATMDPDTGEPTVQQAVATSLVTTQNGTVLRLSPDPTFFTRSDVTYPVTIDPLVNLSVTVDTYVNSQSPGGFPTATVLKSGLEGGVDRALLAFSIDPVTYGQVQSASLDLWESGSASCTAKPVDLWSVTGTFDASVSWNTQPAVGSRYASLTVAKGFSGSCPPGTVTFTSGGDSGLTLTNLVQSWANDDNAFAAVEIRARDETTTSQFKTFNSSEATSNPPVLHVTYDHAPNPPQGLSAAGTGSVVLHGTFSDVDGGTGSLLYTVYNAAGAQVYSASGSTVASASDSQLTLPLNTLQTGYTWKAQAFDGILYSAPSGVQPYPRMPLTGAPPYNVVVIMTDDLDWNTLRTAVDTPCTGPLPGCQPGAGGIMPNYWRYFEKPLEPSAVFDNAFVSYSLCCPSRASFFTGRYAHNTLVKNNSGPNGGCKVFDPTQTVARWLHDPTYAPTPYDTALIGKYLNGYGSAGAPATCKGIYVPRGTGSHDWDSWRSLLYATGTDASYQYKYAISFDGTSRIKDPGHDNGGVYQTDRLKTMAQTFIQGALSQQPFFLYLAPSAPHLDPSYHPDPTDCNYDSLQSGSQWGNLPSIPDADTWDHSVETDVAFNFGTIGPASKASYNEPTDDKPSFLAAFTPNNPVISNCATRLWWDRLEALRSIDGMIGTVATAIGVSNMANTVMIFTSDNGYYNGEHRLHEKIAPYEEGLHVPLAIRYPQLRSDLYGTRHEFVLNNDLAPTIASFANATYPGPGSSYGVDGQSLYQFLTTPLTTWPRKRFLVEHWTPCTPNPVCTLGSPDAITEGNDFYPTFEGIRTSAGAQPDNPQTLYVKYDTNGGGFNQTGDDWDYYDQLGDWPNWGDQKTNQCVVYGFGSVNCPIPSTDPLYPLDQFINALFSCNALAPVYTCQKLEDAAPAITILPTSGSHTQSTIVTVTGSGFVPGETVTVTFKDIGGVLTTGSTSTAAADGSVSGTVTVPINSAVGLGTVFATGVVAAKATFQVT